MPGRRTFIASLLAAATAPRLSWADAGSPAFLACAREAGDSFALYGVAADGTDRFRVALPARGHAGAAHPYRPEAVIFARRPGGYALVIDCARGAVLRRLTPPGGRQFNGHGAFVQDGAVLVTSEQVAEGSEGRLGFWDAAAGYRRIAEFPTGGIGPHEVIRLPDGSLAVANGGIETDPADRTKLNIDRMHPNLAYLSAEGELLECVALEEPLRRNSIRHLAVLPDGTVAFAMQWEGEPGAAPPLLGFHRRRAPVRLASADEADERAMQGYAGSVAFSVTAGEVAISSPRGGRVHLFDTMGRLTGVIRRGDVCGLAPLGDGFVASDGQGAMLAIAGGAATPLARENRSWDNHIVALES